MSVRAGHWLFLVFLLLYGALLVVPVAHKLASLNAHGSVRPPGHLTTEFYPLGAAAWRWHLLRFPCYFFQRGRWRGVSFSIDLSPLGGATF